MEKTIGGFFEQEDIGEGVIPYHTGDAIKLVNGRSALFVLLDHLKPQKVRLPFYSCDTLLQPILQLSVPFEYYPVNQNLLPVIDDFDEDDFIVFINYFGLLEKELLTLAAERNMQHFIIDNTHSFFSRPNGYFAFNSARKFFGVTDGAFLFVKDEHIIIDKLSQGFFNNDFLQLRKKGDLQQSYALYQENELNQPCGKYKISKASDEILNKLNYEYIANKRIENFDFLHKKLAGFNAFQGLVRKDVPFAYPFLPVTEIKRQLLYDNGIFFPTLWKEVMDKKVNGFKWEKELSSYLLPLPIDHRYSTEDMEYIIKHLLNQLR